MTALLLDLDGTIIDPKAGMTRSFRAALEQIGQDRLILDDLDWIIGPSIVSSMERVLDDPAMVDEALRLYREFYVDHAEIFNFAIYPGIIEVIHTLADRFRIHIVTMKPWAFARPIVATLGISQAIGEVFGVELNDGARDKRALLDVVLRQLDIAAADCIVIGDRGSDIAAARAHGMRSIGVKWGFGTEKELSDAQADELCDRPIDLVTAVARSAGQAQR